MLLKNPYDRYLMTELHNFILINEQIISFTSSFQAILEQLAISSRAQLPYQYLDTGNGSLIVLSRLIDMLSINNIHIKIS